PDHTGEETTPVRGQFGQESDPHERVVSPSHVRSRTGGSGREFSLVSGKPGCWSGAGQTWALGRVRRPVIERLMKVVTDPEASNWEAAAACLQVVSNCGDTRPGGTLIGTAKRAAKPANARQNLTKAQSSYR